MGIFKEEAHKADQKFKKLKEENGKLKEIMENPQLSEVKKGDPLKNLLEVYSKTSDSCEYEKAIEFDDKFVRMYNFISIYSPNDSIKKLNMIKEM